MNRMVISTVPDRSTSPTAAEKSQLFADLDRHRRLSPWRCCGCFLLIVVLGALAGALWLVAATGIVSIPGVSQFAFPGEPTPERIVTPAPFDPASLITTGADVANHTASYTLTEGQLTSLVGADHFPMFRQAQVTIDPDGLRFFAIYVEQPFGSPITLRFRLQPALSPTDRCQLDELTVGYVPIPVWTYRSYVEGNCAALESLVTQSVREQRTKLELGTALLIVQLTIPTDGTVAE